MGYIVKVERPNTYNHTCNAHYGLGELGCGFATEGLNEGLQLVVPMEDTLVSSLYRQQGRVVEVNCSPVD